MKCNTIGSVQFSRLVPEHVVKEDERNDMNHVDFEDMCDVCGSMEDVQRLDDGSLVCENCDPQRLVRNAYRQAWRERGVSEKVLEDSIKSERDDEGEWSPHALVVMTTEACLPITTEDIDLAAEIDKRARELCKMNVYTEFTNCAIMSVYEVVKP